MRHQRLHKYFLLENMYENVSVYLNSSCFLTSNVLSFPAKVITHCMEAVVSYFTDDAAAERIDFMELDI